MKTYVGFRAGSKPEVFCHGVTPTVASHGGRFNAVMGPFRTKRAAVLTIEAAQSAIAKATEELC